MAGYFDGSGTWIEQDDGSQRGTQAPTSSAQPVGLAQPASGGGFGDADWDNFLKAQNKTGIQVGTWGPATPTPGSDAQTQGWFNAGSPGSATAAINSHNPSANPDMAYVQGGNTGGYLAGTGVTIGPGRSTRPADYVNMYNQAVEKYGKGVVDEWESGSRMSAS